MLDDDTDLNACAERVAQGDPERMTCAMAAPVAARRILLPIYAFNVEISRAPWMTQEPLIAEMRLQWWADALDEIAAGGLIRRHEIVTPLAMAAGSSGADLLKPCVEARRHDIDTHPFEDMDQLIAYCADSGGVLMQVSAMALGGESGAAAKALGTATAIGSYLRAIPELRARGREPLPQIGGDERGIIRDLAAVGLKYLAKARADRPRVNDVACLPGWLAAPVLNAALKDPSRVQNGTLMPSPFQQNIRRLYVAKTGRW